MPLILEVSLARKIGLPDYGSLGASCGLKLEVDPALLSGDAARIREHLSQAYNICASAVDEELKQRRQEHETVDAPLKETPFHVSLDTPSSPARSSHGRITRKQFDYARELATQIDQVGDSGLSSLAQRMFARSLDKLSSLQASSLIQTLKQLKAGRLKIAEFLPEVAA